MTQTSYPFDGGQQVTEPQWQKMGRLWSNDGVADTAGRLAVTAPGGTRTVNVAPGTAWVQGFLYDSDSIVQLAVQTADATNPRIDLVVLRLDRNLNTIVAAVVTGAPASPATVVAPTPVMTDSLYEYPLATIAVAPASGLVQSADIGQMASPAGRAPAGRLATTKVTNLSRAVTSTGPLTDLGTLPVFISPGRTYRVKARLTLVPQGTAGTTARYTLQLDAFSAGLISSETVFAPVGEQSTFVLDAVFDGVLSSPAAGRSVLAGTRGFAVVVSSKTNDFQVIGLPANPAFIYVQDDGVTPT